MATEFSWDSPTDIARAPEGVVKRGEQAVSWGEFKKLPTFDLRNGDVEDVVPIMIRATIPLSFHWVPVAGLPPAEANTCVDAFIRSHMIHLTANNPGSWTDAQIRKVAIVLGTLRAAATTFYRLVEGDMISGEVTRPYLRVHRDGGGNVFYEPRSDLTTDQLAMVTNTLTLSSAEQVVISEMAKIGAGVIPMQGYSIIMTGHHYLSEGPSRKQFEVVEKSLWASTTLGSWYTDDLVILQDTAWHKATHPVSMKLKTDMAMDLSIKDKLVAASAGVCGSRLPAAETELRTANSYLTLLNTVDPILKICGGGISTGPLQTCFDLVRQIPKNSKDPMKGLAVPKSLTQVVLDRESGIKFLGGMLQRNQDVVAFAYGFYVAQSDAAQMMSTTVVADSLKTSFSLSKLCNASHASYTAGHSHYADYAAFRTAMRARGEYNAPKLDVKP